MEGEYEAFWVFEEEVPNELKNHKKMEPIKDKPIISFFGYEGTVVIDDDGIKMKGKSIKTGKEFQAYIPFSNILKMEKIYPFGLEREEKFSERILKIVYQEEEKKECIYIQEKLFKMNEEEDEEEENY